jgi:hypothetical protein
MTNIPNMNRHQKAAFTRSRAANFRVIRERMDRLGEMCTDEDWDCEHTARMMRHFGGMISSQVKACLASGPNNCETDRATLGAIAAWAHETSLETADAESPETAEALDEVFQSAQRAMKALEAVQAARRS